MLEFELNGQNYRAAKLSAYPQQLHLSRKLGPVLPKLVPLFLQLAGRDPAAGLAGIDVAALADAASPLAAALADMSFADSEYVFGVCLSVVSRQQEKGWSSIWNSSAQAPMFDDIDLPGMTQIVVKVIQDNLGNFMQGLLDKALAASPAIP